MATLKIIQNNNVIEQFESIDFSGFLNVYTRYQNYDVFPELGFDPLDDYKIYVNGNSIWPGESFEALEALFDGDVKTDAGYYVVSSKIGKIGPLDVKTSPERAKIIAARRNSDPGFRFADPSSYEASKPYIVVHLNKNGELSEACFDS